MKTYHPNKNLSKRFNYKRGKFWKLIIALSFATSFLSPQANAFPFGKNQEKRFAPKFMLERKIKLLIQQWGELLLEN